ncbi:hypothetical protein TNCV_3902221 [Trichonephila clavipes]|nr:hypothetical protein TNCV_3902221 [Trichonephila clavipes]
MRSLRDFGQRRHSSDDRVLMTSLVEPWCTIWDCKRYWSPENSRNEPKNSHRTAFQGIILDTADNESLLSNCQTIIRPSRLKEEQFDTWFGSAVIPGFVL